MSRYLGRVAELSLAVQSAGGARFTAPRQTDDAMPRLTLDKGHLESPRPRDVLAVAAPAVVSGAMTLGLAALKASRPGTARKVTRFTNLLLASAITDNGLGSIAFVHPALRSLPERDYFAAKQQKIRNLRDGD